MRNVEVFAGKRAAGYDDFVQVWIPGYPYFVSLLPNLLPSPQIKEILVAGCSTGNEIKALAEANSEYQISGVDPSPEMVLQARQKLRDYANTDIIEGVVSDLDNHKYDAATLLLVLHFMEDNGNKLALLKDLSARLKSKAPLIVFDITGDREQIKQNLLVLSSLLPKELTKEEVTSRLNRLQNEIFHVSESRFIQLCQQAGFEQPLCFFQSTIYKGWRMTKA